MNGTMNHQQGRKHAPFVEIEQNINESLMQYTNKARNEMLNRLYLKAVLFNFVGSECGKLFILNF